MAAENRLFIEIIENQHGETLGYFTRGVFAPQDFLDAVLKEEDGVAEDYDYFKIERVRYGFQKTTYDDDEDPETEYYHAATADELDAYPVTIINVCDHSERAYGLTDSDKWRTWDGINASAVKVKAIEKRDEP